MNFDQDTAKKIEELQSLEHNLQNFLNQKQAIQVELNEIENALTELKSTKGEVYKILGGIMLKSDVETLKKELLDKQKIIRLRIESVEKQENILEKKTKNLRSEINQSIKNANTGKK